MKAFSCFALFWILELSAFADPVSFTRRPCDTLLKNPHEIVKIIRDYSAYQDVSLLVKEAESCTGSKDVLDPKLLSTLEREGYSSEARYWLSVAQNASEYRDPEPELRHYLKYTTLAGAAPQAAQVERLRKTAKFHPSPEQSCPGADLRNQFGEARNQDSVGICFGFVVADLLGAKLGKTISAWDVALAQHDLRNFKIFGHSFRTEKVSETLIGGTIIDAFNEIKAKGACEEARFPSEYAGNDLNLAKLILALERMSEGEESPGGVSAENEVSCGPKDSTRPSVVSSMRVGDVERVAKQSAAVDVVYRLNSIACDSSRFPIPKNLEIERTESENPKPLFDEVNRRLDRKDPVAIFLNADLLRDQHWGSSSSPHASIVVGRRFNPDSKSCEYLIRNSWGRGCDQYDSDYQCEQGNVWIPREILAQAIQKTYAISSK